MSSPKLKQIKDNSLAEVEVEALFLGAPLN